MSTTQKPVTCTWYILAEGGWQTTSLSNLFIIHIIEHCLLNYVSSLDPCMTSTCYVFWLRRFMDLFVENLSQASQAGLIHASLSQGTTILNNNNTPNHNTTILKHHSMYLNAIISVSYFWFCRRIEYKFYCTILLLGLVLDKWLEIVWNKCIVDWWFTMRDNEMQLIYKESQHLMISFCSCDISVGALSAVWGPLDVLSDGSSMDCVTIVKSIK